ncbi:MAG: methyl-accepting chemotaxis protein [Deltaproteobacteria bacterium]|nr:methyl-accepting chemotaxis protein [Deltaproteobacteria bacterium]
MGRTSIKNKLILSFLLLLLIVMIVVSIVNLNSKSFYLAQAISTAIAMGFGIIFGTIFSNSIVRRLKRLSTVAGEISRGDLSLEIELSSRDEVRDLEEVFSAMVHNLRDMISAMLSGLVGKVLIGSRDIDKSARKIAKGSEEQTLIAQKTSVKMDNGLTVLDEMVVQSAQTVSKIGEARDKTRKGADNAGKTLTYLETVLEQMVDYSRHIYSLANKVEKIRLVMNVIDEIAQKTDLLSLNASIEATRASELGKGFALVADEIRSMSENSKHSAKEISIINGDILAENKAVIESLDKSKEGINKGRDVIHSMVDTFDEILSGVDDIFQELKEMEAVNAKQVKELRKLLNHFQQFSNLAGENFVATQKTTIATRNQKEDMKEIVVAMKSLNILSQKMDMAQQRFKLEKG